MYATIEKEKQPETFVYNPERRLYDDTTTWLAEVVHGSMQSEFVYELNGQDLVAEDGSSLKQIFEDALDESYKLPANLYFESRRRQHELEEYQDMLAMAQGGGPNTMVVVSDFPQELEGHNEDVGGYNVTRQQTMLRVISRRQDGSLHIQSQSLDGSNRRALEQLYEYLEVDKPEQGELLGQRRHFNLDSDIEQAKLIGDLRGQYDQSLKVQTGAEHFAGIKHGRQTDTLNFVKAQTDVLQMYFDKVETINDDNQLLYAVAATITERFSGALKLGRLGDDTAWTTDSTTGFVPERELADQVWQAAQRATSAGKTFSGCGGSIKAGTTDANGQLSELGYGDKADEKTSYSFNKKQHCVVCQPKPKDDEPKKMCGPCGICRSCDAKL